jgi:hypothetical protein
VGEHAAPEIWNAYETALDEKSLDPENDPAILAWTEHWGGSPFLAAVGMDGMLADYDEVELTLQTGVEPISTNGSWENGAVIWKLHVNADRADATWTAPTAFAIWAAPDDSTQQTMFGATRLAGDELSKHLLWLATRTREDQLAWRRLLDDIAPMDAQARSDRLRDARNRQPQLADGITMLYRLLD